jgi:hypothetical protein
MGATWMVDAVPAAASGTALKAYQLVYQPAVVQKINGAAIN